jgi:putative addiction module killer protein
MIEVRKTGAFDAWLRSLRDVRAKAKIEVRIRRLGLGNPGDVKSLGAGISEMRITEGKGYRVYFTTLNGVIVILLCGGDKSSQRRDIEIARTMARDLESHNDD